VRIYVDTSVFGGYFEPGVDVPTRRLFDMFIRGEARLVLSDTTVTELARAPSRVRELPDLLPPEHVERSGPPATRGDLLWKLKNRRSKQSR